MYSQYAEEEYILDALNGMPPGRLLDIGAWDPICFSNSRALIEKGWSAILMEPSPGPVKNLVKAYQDNLRVNVIAAAVTVGGGLVEMQITDDAVTMPSADSARVEAWLSTAGFYGKLLVPSLSFSSLIMQFGGNFQFVSIDTEGTSVDLFVNLMALGPRPRCVVVEHDDRIVELVQHAAAANYAQIHLNGTNVVFRWRGPE